MCISKINAEGSQKNKMTWRCLLISRKHLLDPYHERSIHESHVFELPIETKSEKCVIHAWGRPEKFEVSRPSSLLQK